VNLKTTELISYTIKTSKTKNTKSIVLIFSEAQTIPPGHFLREKSPQKSVKYWPALPAALGCTICTSLPG